AGRKYMPLVIGDFVCKYPTGSNLYGLNINRENIKRSKIMIIGESEKFVMQHNTFYPDQSVAVALNGSSLSYEQIKYIKDLGVEEVVLALDKEFKDASEEKEYAEKIVNSIIKKLHPMFKVSIIWDKDNLIEYKDSPTDQGKEIYEKLYKNRVIYKDH
ncbi:hypothetical protein, partial [Cetobacterium sp.]|uniref:hypothetical protein n=1 Tax=Cetobacterium sp. TaxID=2071632 RepID=UPI003EE6C57B